MASVSPHKVRLCSGCKAQGRTKPAGTDACRCKVLSWRCYWRNPDGAKRSQVYDLKRDADLKKAEVESSQHNGTYVDPMGGRELFTVFADKWAEGQDWKATTRQNWPARLARLTWALVDGAHLGDIDQLALKRARIKLAGRYARSTVEGTMHLLMAIMRAAVVNGKIGRDPTVGVDAAPKTRGDDTTGVTPDKVPSRSEALAILQASISGWRAALALGLAGLRIGEVLGMRKDRLALDQCRITVDAQAVELSGKGVLLATTKNERVRSIVIPQPTADELRRHLHEGHGGIWVDADGVAHDMLFLRPDGTLWRQASFKDIAWTPTLAAARLVGRFTFHALRHHCASALLAEGCPLPIAAGYLGDHPQTILRVYAHWLPDDAEVPAAILARILAPDTPDASPMPQAA